MKPIVIINLKTYKQGKEVLNLVKKIESVDKSIIIGASPENVSMLHEKTNLPIYSEHVDYQFPGRNTGFILPEGMKALGAEGVFLNHSEHRLSWRVIKKTVKRCNSVRLKTAVFAKDLRQARKIRKLNPDYLIIEPPELVAGKKSVSKAKPELIENVAKKLNYPFIVGAGIKDSEDLKIAMKLGASGIALSSAVAKAKNPKKVLRDLLR